MIKIEPQTDSLVTVEGVFDALESERENKLICENLTGSSVKYQISHEYPEYLEQINDKGEVVLGVFTDGSFKPVCI